MPHAVTIFLRSVGQVLFWAPVASFYFLQSNYWDELVVFWRSIVFIFGFVWCSLDVDVFWSLTALFPIIKSRFCGEQLVYWQNIYILQLPDAVIQSDLH